LSSLSWTFLSTCIHLYTRLWQRALSPYWEHKFMWTSTPCTRSAH
jgi:hypothetical protein